jgi:putative DNA primase/helicase
MLDIDTGNITGHDPEHLNTYTLDITAREDHKPDCPTWKQFLNDSIGDQATIRELQKFFGYCYTRETRHEKALYLIGPGGDGKGTIIKVLRSIIGEVNCSTVGMSDLQDQFYRVMLVDKLLNSTTEIRSELFQSDLLKTLISGEPVSAAHKHRPAFSFNPVAKHVFSGNTYPDIKDHTDGLYRRLLLIEMDQQFVAQGKADKYLYDKLHQDRDGIFLWGLAGWLMLRNEGFTPSEAMQDNLELFKQKNNPIHSFVVCHVRQAAESAFVPSQDIYESYKKFCTKRGHQAHSLTNTMLMLKQMCPWIKKREKRVKGNKFLGYNGIEIVEIIGESA